MKTIIKILFVALLFCTTIQTSNAQDEQTQFYYTLSYMKVAPGMHDDYLALEKVWKKIHAKNIEAGKYTHWVLNKVISPVGSEAAYNYMTRTAFKGETRLSNHLEKFPLPADPSSFLTKDEIDLLMRTSEIRTMVKEEVMAYVDAALAENVDETTIEVYNYFDIPDGAVRADHHKMESDLWKPIHQSRIDANETTGWVLAKKVFPFGSRQEYFDITVDLYVDMNQYMNTNMRPHFSKVYPEMEISELIKQSEAVSELIKGEVQIRIDAID